MNERTVMSDRLKELLKRAAQRNPRATSLHAIAAAIGVIRHRNTVRSLIEHAEDWEARYDIEGPICWRDPHLRSEIGRRAAR